MNRTKHILTDTGIVCLCGLLPVLVAHLSVDAPRHRHIHIESFRYGKDPSVIRCARGDTLHLTFSSRDTGHSFFLEEFDLDVKVSPSNNRVLEFRASDPGAPPSVRTEVVLVAAHRGVYNYLISKSFYRCHVWCGPMHAFEHGMLIITPNTLLWLGLGLLLGLLVVTARRMKKSAVAATAAATQRCSFGIDIFAHLPLLEGLLKKRWLQPVFMLLGALFLYIVILTTLFGTQMSGRNLGVMLIWIVWLFLVICVFTPLGGRIWCLACPLPMAGEFLQRQSVTRVREGSEHGYRNRFLGLNLSWPRRLSNGWLRLLLFLVAATFSTTFVAKPRATGMAIVLLLIAATVMALIWRLRSFCMYVCPISAFLSVYAKLGRLALRQVDAATCASCRPAFCEKGSHRGWACPYGLNVGTVDDNLDCGLCMHCLRSCLYNNVTLRWRRFGAEAAIGDTSTAWTAMVMFVIAMAYTVLYLGHWPAVRDYVNILDKGNWDLFGIYTLILWSSALCIFPAFMLAIAGLAKRLSGVPHKSFTIMTRSSGALLPLGLFIWVAFISQMFSTNVSFVAQSVSDPFGWGWNLFGQAGMPWVQLLPRFVPWLQVAAVLVGFAYSARNLKRIWLTLTTGHSALVRGMLPHMAVLGALASAFILFYAN